MSSAEYWIGSLGLERHPEGGWYRETYRSEGAYPFDTTSLFGSSRSYATSIYYLLEEGDRSRLHRIHSDELWFFHAGCPLEVSVFPDQGTPSPFTLGLSPDAGLTPGGWVPAGCWFGARLLQPATTGSFSLVSCVVAPGFDFRDFSFANKDSLLARFPDHHTVIDALA